MTRAIAASLTLSCVVVVRAGDARHQGERLAGTVVVTDGREQVPAADATVELRTRDVLLQRLTDARGMFEFSQLLPGYYDLSVRKSGYPAAVFGSGNDGLPGVRIAVFEGRTPATVVLPLSKGAVIEGRVFSANGTAAPDVQLLPVERRTSGLLSLVPSSASITAEADHAVHTALDGSFRIFGLSPGRYTLRASQRSTPRPVYYPGTTDPDEAQVLDLAAGQSVSLAFNLPSQSARATFRVRGRIAAGNAAFENADIVLEPAARSGITGAFSATAVPGEEFVVDRVPAGSYRLDARSCVDLAGPATACLWAQAAIDVPALSASGIDLLLESGMTLSGRVNVLGAGGRDPLPNLTLSPLPTWPRQTTFRVPVGPEGRFSVAGVPPGRFRAGIVTASGPTARSGWALDSICSSDGACAIDTVDVRPHENLAGLTVQITSQTQHVSGFLVGPDGAPATAFTLLVYPSSRLLRTPALRRMRVARPATDGYFEFPGLPSGNYRLVALPSATALPEPDALDAATDQTMVFSLSPGETKALGRLMAGGRW
jgi:hypothetical protein